MYFEIEDLIKEYPNKFIYAVIGARGVGKSYSTKRKVIKDFLNKGYQTMIFRRYVNQIDLMSKDYFNDIMEKEFSDHEFKLLGDVGYLDKKPFCIFRGLNSASVSKGSSFPNIHNVIYEEFMPDSGERIIKNEYQKFETALFTIDRGENRVTVFLLGNNTSFYNPIFDTLKLYPPSKGGKCSQNSLMVIKNLETPSDFKKRMSRSNIGQLSIMSGTSAYNIDNENITNDTFNVVNKKELWEINKLKPVFQVRVANNKIIKVWYCDIIDGYYFIDNNSKSNVTEYFCENEYQNSNNKHISLLGRYEQRRLILYQKVGGVFYNNAETKYYFDTMIKYLRR